jgi:type II secretory pathway component PulF
MLVALTVMVILELVFWTLSFFSIWLNDIWTFLALGVLAVSLLFIMTLNKDKAERQAQELFASSKKAKETDKE